MKQGSESRKITDLFAVLRRYMKHTYLLSIFFQSTSRGPIVNYLVVDGWRWSIVLLSVFNINSYVFSTAIVLLIAAVLS